jgi:hypothetical protein
VEETLNDLLEKEAQELTQVARHDRTEARQVTESLREMRLREAAKKVEDSIEETLTYMEFPYEHWLRIRTNNVIERLNREIRRRTRAVVLSLMAILHCMSDYFESA